MTRSLLDRLSEAYGLQLSYLGTSRQRQVASDRTKRAVLRAMSVPVDDDAAMARSLADAPPTSDARIAAPAGVRCYMPAWLDRGRAWGVTCQLYGLRSARNHGIGDFEDLACLAERVAAEGGDFIGINPVHALFTAAPERCSPFSPSNRSFLNPIYIALDRLPGINAPIVVDEPACARLRAAARIDYAAVAQLKFGALKAFWRKLLQNPDLWQAWSRQAFESFVSVADGQLSDHALFEALSHHMVAQGYGAGWQSWPEEFRDRHNATVRRFEAAHSDEIRFHLWLQWLADAQLEAAAARARATGMRIGLYLDFAVGTAADGSATWSDPELVVPGASIGAPPDAFFASGQDWGLAPLSPAVMRRRGFATWRRMLRAATHHAGAIRLDHAMGLHRLFWIPRGMAAPDGCYVRYPLADMLRTLADVSCRREALVIGEDLGTVPPGFREMMRDVDMLSYSLLFFERTRGGFRAARSYRRNAFVSASTHDLPPLASWWSGGDITLFRDLDLYDGETATQRRAERARDREALLARLHKDLPRGAASALPNPDGRLTSITTAAVHAFLARTPSRLLGVQFEDLCGAELPVNIPGTSVEYPNWRLRAAATVEDAAQSDLWRLIIGAVVKARPRRP